MTESEPLPLETYVLVLAHVLQQRGGNEAVVAVLGRLNVSAEQFRRAEEYWTAELAQCLPRRKGVVAMKFATAFAEARARVGLIDPMSRETTTPGVAAAVPATSLPSYLRDPPVQVAPVPAAPSMNAAVARPAQVPEAVRDRSVAHDGVRPLVHPLAVEAIQEDATIVATSNYASPPAAALPFTAAPAPAHPLLVAEREAMRPIHIDTGTAVLSTAGPLGPATPWGQEGLPMEIEKYASLSVELAKKAGNPHAILQRYGFSDAESFRQLDLAMRDAINKHAGLRARYHALVMRYSTNLAR